MKVKNEKAILEARVSMDDKVIFTDKTPKSLFEYHLNGYTEKDILTLVENLRMEFDVWDKTCNLYKSSNDLIQLSQGDIAVLYEDSFNNAFLYSFATKKIYFYNPEKMPYIHLDKGLTVIDFLDVAKRDFEALLRTPYGKKYVTEGAVLVEGLKEFFGYGKALRIFIDGKKNDKRYAIDEHTFACVDALLDFSKSFITQSEYEKILGRTKSVAEVYQNSKLGERDSLRRMKPKNDCLLEERIDSFGNILETYGQDADTVYADYCVAKTYNIALSTARPQIESFLKKNAVFKASYVMPKGENYIGIDAIINNPLCALSSYSFGFEILQFDMAKFRNRYIASINNRIQRFSNADIHIKFLAYIDKVVSILQAADKANIWTFYADINVTENEAANDCKGICTIKATTYGNEAVNYRHDTNKKSSTRYKSLIDGKSLPLVHVKLFEYLAGYDLETRYQNQIKEAYGIEPTYEAGDDFNWDDADIDELMGSKLSESLFESTLMAVLEERELSRKIAHNVKQGYETVKKAVGRGIRSIESITDPLAKEVRNLVDNTQKQTENENREIVITNSTFLRLKRAFTRTLLPGLAAWKMLSIGHFIIAAWAAWYFKTDDKATKDKIIRELETELKLVREKIEDAKSDNSRDKKYELMRLESKIEDELARIKYGRD